MVRFGLGSALPGTVIIGRDGRIARVISGVVNQPDLKKQIDQMLASGEATAKREQVAQAKERKAKTTAVPS
jgi:hypothetical protein